MEIPEWTKKIEYGLTNQSYLLKTDEILRISNAKINKIFDRENEMKILEILKNTNQKVSVEILNYGFNEQNYFFLKTKYLPFAYNLIQQEVNKNKIDQIFKVLQKFKSLNIKNKNIKLFNWKEQLQIFKTNIKNFQFDLTEYEIDIAKIFKNYKPKKVVLSHNNLMRNNFLFNDDKKQIYLIDFEYSSMNDELYDIASFISETLIYEENEDKKNELRAYWLNLFNLNQEDIEIINKWIFYQNVLNALWANAMYDITKDKEFLKIIELRYREIKKMY